MNNQQEILDGLETSQRITEVKGELIAQLKAGKDVFDRLLNVVDIEKKFLGKAREFLGQTIKTNPELVKLTEEFTRIERLNEVQKTSLQQKNNEVFIKSQIEEEKIYRGIEKALIAQLKKKKNRVSIGKLRNLAAIMMLFLALTANAALAQGQNTLQEKDSSTIIQYASRQGESIVADSVMRLLMEARAPGSSERMVNTVALYTRFNRVYPQSTIDRFKALLTQAGFDSASVADMAVQLFQPGTILIAQSKVNTPEFQQILLHERMHRGIDQLTDAQKDTLFTAARNVSEAIRADPVRFCISRLRYGDLTNNCMQAGDEARRTILEFYPYLASGYFTQDITQQLQTEYPDAFALFTIVFEHARS